MNAEALKAWFEENKTAVLGVAGAGVVGLALLQRKKSSSSTSTGTATTSTTGSGTAATSAGVQSVYPDTTETNLYNSLLEQLQGQVSNSDPGIGSAPAPIASTLFAPTGSGNYIRDQEGGVIEVESDGSLFALDGPMQQKLGLDASTIHAITDSAIPAYYGLMQNLGAANTGKAPVPTKIVDGGTKNARLVPVDQLPAS